MSVQSCKSDGFSILLLEEINEIKELESEIKKLKRKLSQAKTKLSEGNMWLEVSIKWELQKGIYMIHLFKLKICFYESKEKSSKFLVKQLTQKDTSLLISAINGDTG